MKKTSNGTFTPLFSLATERAAAMSDSAIPGSVRSNHFLRPNESIVLIAGRQNKKFTRPSSKPDKLLKQRDGLYTFEWLENAYQMRNCIAWTVPSLSCDPLVVPMAYFVSC